MFVYLPSIRSIPRSTIHLNKLCPFFSFIVSCEYQFVQALLPEDVPRTFQVSLFFFVNTNVHFVHIFIKMSSLFIRLISTSFCAALWGSSLYVRKMPRIHRNTLFVYGSYLSKFTRDNSPLPGRYLMGKWERTYMQNLSLYLNSSTSGCYIYFQW